MSFSQNKESNVKNQPGFGRGIGLLGGHWGIYMGGYWGIGGGEEN